MALIIRMKRMGKSNTPFYRIVAADSRRSAKGGAYVQELGYYNPSAEPAVIKVDREKTEAWLAKGAAVSNTAKTIFKKMGITIPKKVKKSKKKEKK